MNQNPSWKRGLQLRLATLVLPPLGLVLLYRSGYGVWRKLLGTVGIALYSLLYAALICWILVRSGRLEVEWRGGYVPALTSHKTSPDYDSLERHRAKQSAISRAASSSANHSAYWTGFRGPNRDGRYDEDPILTNWPASGPPLLWRQPCGGGYSSFAVAEGVAFTIEQRRDQEAAVAYRVDDGRELWSHGWNGLFSESMGGDGPRSTLAWSEGRVYALGALGELVCLQAADGKVIWSHDIAAETRAPIPTYGFSASPLIVGDKLIVTTAAGHGKSVLCYGKTDGDLLWSSLDDVTGYASPDLLGSSQLIICCETRAVGLGIENGQQLWSEPWRVLNNQLPIAQPVQLASNRFLLSAGYFTGSKAVEISGQGTNFSTRTLWKNKDLKNKFTSSVFHRGHVYGLDEDILTCLDAATGERKWKDGRYGYGQLIIAGDQLIILTGDGEVAVVLATPEGHQERVRFRAISGKTWNHPALAEGKLLVRNGAEMACFSLLPTREH